MNAKTKEMLELEELHGKPLEELLPLLFNELVGTQKVADRRGVSRNTIYIWCRIFRVVTQRGSSIVETP